MLVTMWMASAAHAVGIGSTGALGLGGWGGGDLFDFGSGGFAPSLDIRAEPVIVQIHVLEFTEALVDDEELYLGANVLFAAGASPLHGPWLGVVQPGFGFDIVGDPLLLSLTGQCRLGVEAQEAAGVGLYVVPELGIALADNQSDWIAGGSLQLSVWFGT